ncbi:PREDICTED: bifunctional transcriptional activator/DNA repair enzyme Ada [Nicrophorus vespilloides]|uniref:Methylated-DNA--protein-cysteine methyltransferase n=1 Tax=Nicrophorus vespilloides TaxID=110193 RepID=A0ABM1MZA7_NICVS|nr:PREDICTED: bifunctional transcriptional activator/DNA repair enzyme Ada [Nicrophorus vespilloides]
MSGSKIEFSTITTDEYKKLTEFEIIYGVVESQFGHCLIALNNESICYMSLFDEGKENSAIDHLTKDWPNATLREDNKKIEEVSKGIFESNSARLNVLLRGTELQCNVWKELTNLKEGMTASYEQIAKAVGNPKAIRAVASAIAKNKIAYLIPCHRVIRKTGAPNKYRWGPERKIQILKLESKK